MSEQTSTPGTAQPPAQQPQGNAISRWWKGQSAFGKIRIVVVALIVVIGAPIAYIASQSAPSAAEVGDCMVGQDENSLKIVDCADPAAEWEVVGRLNDKLRSEATPTVCSAFPTTEIYFWEGKEGQTGYVLCLAGK